MTDSTKLRNQHIQTVHRYQCGLCDYNAISANGLKGHIKVMTVSDTHVTNVSMLQQQLIILKFIKKANIKELDTHATNVSMLHQQLSIL